MVRYAEDNYDTEARRGSGRNGDGGGGGKEGGLLHTAELAAFSVGSGAGGGEDQGGPGMIGQEEEDSNNLDAADDDYDHDPDGGKTSVGGVAGVGDGAACGTVKNAAFLFYSTFFCGLTLLLSDLSSSSVSIVITNKCYQSSSSS